MPQSAPEEPETDVAAYRRAWQALQARRAAIVVRDDVRAKVRAMVDRVATEPLVDPRVLARPLPKFDYRAGGDVYKRRPRRVKPDDIVAPVIEEFGDLDVAQLVREAADASLA